MTDSEPPNRPRGRPQAARSKGTRGQGRRSSNQPFTIRFPQVALLHQARVQAMQSLYEADLTDHELDDILQNMGVPKRSELTAWFRELTNAAHKAVQSIEVLARAVDRQALASETGVEEELGQFNAASRAIVNEVAAGKDEPDGEPVDDWFASVQKQVTGQVQRILRRHRDDVEAAIRRLEPVEEGDEASELAELGRRPGVLSGEPATPQEPAAGGLGVFGQLSAAARRRLDDFLGPAEQQSLGHQLEMLRHADRLARGVVRHQPEIDPIVERAAPAFPMPQLASVDRVVLRLAVYELLHEPKVPLKVAINEAVEIAKRYGGPNSGKFVNGVLRTIAESMPDRAGAT